MSLTDVVIVSAVRTPFGKFGGNFVETSAIELGALTITNTLSTLKLQPEQVSHVYLGTVFPGGLSQVPARQAAFLAGIPKNVISVGIDKACCSATESIVQGVRALRAGEAEIVVCGGMENMSQVPYLQKNMRWGSRMGDSIFSDYLIEGLTWPLTNLHMGIYAENAARERKISREEQDDFAYESHQKWKAAWQDGHFADEVFPVSVKKGKKEEIVTHDEHPRPNSTREQFSNLPPAFSKDGEITAGNSSGISDGAAVLVLMTREKAVELGLKPLATIKGYAQVGGNPEDMAFTPAWAIAKVVSGKGLKVSDIDLFEINEAFAAVTLVSMRELNISRDKTNVKGGSVSIGHPVGATGARIVMTLMYELRRRGQTLGVAALCAAGAQGDAILIQVEE